jgi:hypothetical protein
MKELLFAQPQHGGNFPDLSRDTKRGPCANKKGSVSVLFTWLMRREIEFVKSALLQQVLERSASPMKAYPIGERMNHFRLSLLMPPSIMQIIRMHNPQMEGVFATVADLGMKFMLYYAPFEVKGCDHE